MEKDFENEIGNILSSLGNTNYDSIIGEIKIIIYFQELLIRKIVTKDELLELFYKVSINFNEREVLIQIFGEIGQNLTNSHKCKPIWEDFGESYLLYLIRVLMRFQKDNTLLNECNE